MSNTSVRHRVGGHARIDLDLTVGRGAVTYELHDGGAAVPADTTAGAQLAVAADLAAEHRVPLVVVLSSTGADPGAGLDALHAWGTAARSLVACSGRVPVLAAAIGPAVSAGALVLGLADQVVMTEQAHAFVSGPRAVRSFTGIEIEPDELGGSGVHHRETGVASLVVPDADEARDAVSELVRWLPPSVDDPAPAWPTADPLDRLTPEATDLLPAQATGGYDVRDVLGCIVDDGDLLELREGWAPNLVTALAHLGGRLVGIVANQPNRLAGTLDIAASQKGARFVSFCDAFGIPLLTVVDTPGFSPGRDLEWRGMIRHGAQLAFCYARATVPRVCLTLRKSYGGAYIVMDSTRMGSDLCLAWPTAELAVMGAKGAVEILHRRAGPHERATLEAEYEQRLLNPWIAAERGLLDAVIAPADTRRELVAAFDLLADKRESLVQRSHDNLPL